MATIGGAKAIHHDHEIGSLEPGKRADVILVRTDRPHQTPVYNPYSALVYATNRAKAAAPSPRGGWHRQMGRSRGGLPRSW